MDLLRGVLKRQSKNTMVSWDEKVQQLECFGNFEVLMSKSLLAMGELRDLWRNTAFFDRLNAVQRRSTKSVLCQVCMLYLFHTKPNTRCSMWLVVRALHIPPSAFSSDSTTQVLHKSWYAHLGDVAQAIIVRHTKQWVADVKYLAPISKQILPVPANC